MSTHPHPTHDLTQPALSFEARSAAACRRFEFDWTKMGRPLFLLFAIVSFALAHSAHGAVSARSSEYALTNPQNAKMGVLQVRNEGVEVGANAECRAVRNDEIWVDVWNVSDWITSVMQDPRYKDQLPASPSARDLVPVLDGVALSGVHPDSADVESDHLRFQLTRSDTAASKAAWAHLLDRPVFQRPMGFTLGFEGGPSMPTWVLREGGESRNHFSLIIMPKFRLGLGIFVIAGTFLIFLVLARQTDIIRDTTAPFRIDGRRPYSLGRSQMAFWFFLVIASYFFLWLLTGDTDTLNESTLGLIGISAGTALGAALVDTAKVRGVDLTQNLPAVNLNQPRDKIVTDLDSLLTAKKKALGDAQAARSGLVDQAALDANERLQAALAKQIEVIETQAAYFQWPPWKGVMYDLLSEDNLITFHRFQIFVWTLVLGIIFIFSVYTELRMPEFSATLLGLMGLSAGTYVGFKFPENAKTGQGAVAK